MKFISPVAGRAQRRTLAGLALILVIVVVVAIVLLTRSPGQGNASAQGSSGTSTATVQRRDLVETDTESGTLSYAGAQTVYNRVSGTITWLPSVGQEIRPGQALFRIDNQPIILMNGPTPAYRDLSAADVQGPDVLELNRNLIALGFNPDGIVDDDVWQAATTAGVEQYQASLGETETGILTLGQVVFLPGPQLISTVDGTVGSTGGSSAGSSNTSTSYDPAGSHSEFVDLTTTTQTSPTTTSPTPTSPHRSHGKKHGQKHHKTPESLKALIALLKAEVAELKADHNSTNPSSPSHNSSNNSKNNKNSKKHSSSNNSGSNNSSSNNSSSNSPSSSAGSSATEILQTSSTHLVVTVDLAASSQSEAVRGEHVTVEMPNNTTVNGVISQVSKVAQTSSSGNNGSGTGNSPGSGGNGNSGNSATIPVTIRLLGHVTGAGLDQAPVSVNFSQARAKNVLSVPVTALVATAGGNYAVQAAAAPHKLIPVKTGLFAAGFVAISGTGIYQGLQVTDSQG